MLTHLTVTVLGSSVAHCLTVDRVRVMPNGDAADALVSPVAAWRPRCGSIGPGRQLSSGRGRAKSHADHRFRVSLEHQDFLSALHVPDANRFVRTGGGHTSAVGLKATSRTAIEWPLRKNLLRLAFGHFFLQPGAGERPISMRRDTRDVQGHRCLLDGHSGEVAKRNQPALDRVKLLQAD